MKPIYKILLVVIFFFALRAFVFREEKIDYKTQIEKIKIEQANYVKLFKDLEQHSNNKSFKITRHINLDELYSNEKNDSIKRYMAKNEKAIKKQFRLLDIEYLSYENDCEFAIGIDYQRDYLYKLNFCYEDTLISLVKK